MKELYLLVELTERADAELLRQLIHLIADKDPIVRRECLDFLRQKIELPPQSIIKANAEEIWALWEELESDLSELDEYGGGSEEMKEHVSECLSQIEVLLREKEISKEERTALIEEVLPFIRSGNAGMDDALYNVAYATCKDHEDWLSLAQIFEKVGKDWSLDHARRIYRKIGEHEKYLQLRAMKMIYGLDYYDLVTFYSERGKKDKALAVAQEGMSKAQGRMDELREFMAKHFSEIGDRSKFLKIQFMQVADRITVDSYEKFKNECSSAEWKEYEPQMLMLLEKSGVYQQLKIRMLRQEYEQALRLLQKIEYPHRSWGGDSVLQEAAILENKFPEQVLEFYQKGLGSYNVSADRKIYAEKAGVALKIRHMLVDVMNQPAKWKNMIQEIKFLNKQRKAFFEEFSKVVPDWNID
jgi:hypothetical protein